VSVDLSHKERAMLDGRCGEAVQEAMSVIVQMAEATGAHTLKAVQQAHIDACALMAPSNLDFVSRIVAQAGRVAVPTTLNMVSLDLEHWQDLKVSPSFAKQATQIADAYLKLGCIPTWTCAPYQGYLTPRYGQQIAWGESNAVVYANSVLGARTNRYADYMDVCAAITGRVPYTGLHCTENRRGEILVRPPAARASEWDDTASWAVLGHLVGQKLGTHIPVFEGLPASASTDQLKALGAAAASSGAVAMFHAVGITPEAPDLSAAFQGGLVPEALGISREAMRAAWEDMSQAAAEEAVDAVVLGCPHFSYDEFRQLAEAICTEKSKAHENVQVLVLTSSASFALAQRGGLIEPIQKFGAIIALDTCPFHSPVVVKDARVMMTNSGKAAYYAPGELGVRVAFTSLDGCVRSAASGRVVTEETLWSK
jgi:predicted aconitase